MSFILRPLRRSVSRFRAEVDHAQSVDPSDNPVDGNADGPVHPASGYGRLSAEDLRAAAGRAAAAGSFVDGLPIRVSLD